MARTFAVCALLVVFSSLSMAQEPTETVIRLTVSPAAEPKPALRYQLLPDLTELNPGNPVHGYLKCFMEQQHFFHDKQAVADREKWQTAPLKELPLAQLKGYGGIALKQADYAARLDNPEWQILLRARTDGIGLLLPEVQQLRMLAAALKVRFRAEVGDRRFDDALVTAKTMFAMARHMSEHPTLIADLVGIAIAMIAIGPLDEMLDQPGCPNLYWALTELPDPLVSLRKGMQGERLLMVSEFGGLDQTAPMSEDQLARAVRKSEELIMAIDGRNMEKRDPWIAVLLDNWAKDQDHVKAARKRLVERGLKEEAVAKFPARQVLLLDQVREYEVQRDEGIKWTALPYWQADEGLRRLEAKPKDESLFAGLAPRTLKVRIAMARLEQRIALLRHVEAIRMYAAEHDGKVPAKLADIRLPLPVDPMTGKAFGYSVEENTAKIQGTPPRGHEKTAAYNVRYEVTIRK